MPWFFWFGCVSEWSALEVMCVYGSHWWFWQMQGSQNDKVKCISEILQFLARDSPVQISLRLMLYIYQGYWKWWFRQMMGFQSDKVNDITKKTIPLIQFSDTNITAFHEMHRMNPWDVMISIEVGHSRRQGEIHFWNPPIFRRWQSDPNIISRSEIQSSNPLHVMISTDPVISIRHSEVHSWNPAIVRTRRNNKSTNGRPRTNGRTQFPWSHRRKCGMIVYKAEAWRSLALRNIERLRKRRKGSESRQIGLLVADRGQWRWKVKSLVIIAVIT
jgi:hypothetical protein